MTVDGAGTQASANSSVMRTSSFSDSSSTGEGPRVKRGRRVLGKIKNVFKP